MCIYKYILTAIFVELFVAVDKSQMTTESTSTERYIAKAIMVF